jgi:hypothetical protein
MKLVNSLPQLVPVLLTAGLLPAFPPVFYEAASNGVLLPLASI